MTPALSYQWNSLVSAKTKLKLLDMVGATTGTVAHPFTALGGAVRRHVTEVASEASNAERLAQGRHRVLGVDSEARARPAGVGWSPSGLRARLEQAAEGGAEGLSLPGEKHLGKQMVGWKAGAGGSLPVP